MTSLSQQLREALEDYKRCDGEECDYIANQTMGILPSLLTEHEALQRKADTADEAFKQLEKIRIDQFTVKGDGANKLYPAHQYDERVLRLISEYREATKPSDV